jgi:hypothetical protein
VRRVNRRLSLALSVTIVATLAAATTTGCSSFADSDNIARVNNATLTVDDFEAELVDLQLSPDQPVPGDAARFAISRWIQQQLVSPEEIEELYTAGFETSGTLCINAIVVGDEANANEVAGELAGGSNFAELFESRNIDESLNLTAGALDCITAEQVAQLAGTEFVDVAAGLQRDDPPGIAPVVDESGAAAAWVVLTIRPFAELTAIDINTVASTIDVDDRRADADVFVDPRYGTFDATIGQVVALR